MTVASFTPGPWQACHSGGVSGAVVCEVDRLFGEFITIRSPDSVMWSSDEHEACSNANAALIAAAPELYAALEETCTSLMIVSEQALDASKTDARWLGVYENLLRYVREGQDALAKARGETNG